MADEEGSVEEIDDSKPKVRVIAPIEGLEKRTQLAPFRVTQTQSRMCTYHPQLPAVYICAQCQSSLCVNCAIPYGQLFICSQCYQPPRVTTQPQTEEKEPEKPPFESIIGFFGGLLILIGFFLPWATSDYISPRTQDNYTPYATGFNIALDYPEVILILTMGILIMIVEFLLIILATSPTMVKRPPIGIRLVPMFMAFIAYIILAEIIIRAEGFVDNMHAGWLVCFIGASLTLWRGALDVWKHYKGVSG
jgi:hypothetical protein